MTANDNCEPFKVAVASFRVSDGKMVMPDGSLDNRCAKLAAEDGWYSTYVPMVDGEPFFRGAIRRLLGPYQTRKEANAAGFDRIRNINGLCRSRDPEGHDLLEHVVCGHIDVLDLPLVEEHQEA